MWTCVKLKSKCNAIRYIRVLFLFKEWTKNYWERGRAGGIRAGTNFRLTKIRGEPNFRLWKFPKTRPNNFTPLLFILLRAHHILKTLKLHQQQPHMSIFLIDSRRNKMMKWNEHMKWTNKMIIWSVQMKWTLKNEMRKWNN